MRPAALLCRSAASVALLADADMPPIRSVLPVMSEPIPIRNCNSGCIACDGSEKVNSANWSSWSTLTAVPFLACITRSASSAAPLV